MEASFPKIFVISLPQSIERRKRLTQHMDALKLPFEFLDAVNGGLLTETDARVDWKEVEKYPGWLNRGILGCALSHLAAYDKIVRRHLPYAVILEDDCVPFDGFPRILEHLPGHLTGNTVMMLYYSCLETLQLEKSSVRGIYDQYVSVAAKSVERVLRTVAYAITYEAASSLRQSLLPIRVGPDSWGYFSANRMVETIRFVYPLCCDHDDGKSTIDYFGQATLRRNLALFIDKTKIFPAYQILKLKRRRINERMHRIQLV